MKLLQRQITRAVERLIFLIRRLIMLIAMLITVVIHISFVLYYRCRG